MVAIDKTSLLVLRHFIKPAQPGASSALVPFFERQRIEHIGKLAMALSSSSPELCSRQGFDGNGTPSINQPGSWRGNRPLRRLPSPSTHQAEKQHQAANVGFGMSRMIKPIRQGRLKKRLQVEPCEVSAARPEAAQPVWAQ